MTWGRLTGRKSLAWRGARGRFARPPSLERAGLVRVCAACGSIHVRDDEGRFPSACRECREPLEAEENETADEPAAASRPGGRPPAPA